MATISISDDAKKCLDENYANNKQLTGHTTLEQFSSYIILSSQSILNHADPKLEMVQVSNEHIKEIQKQIKELELKNIIFEQTIIAFCQYVSTIVTNITKIPKIPMTSQAYLEHSKIMFSEIENEYRK
jgi:hypothetical protein